MRFLGIIFILVFTLQSSFALSYPFKKIVDPNGRHVVMGDSGVELDEPCTFVVKIMEPFIHTFPFKGLLVYCTYQGDFHSSTRVQFHHDGSASTQYDLAVGTYDADSIFLEQTLGNEVFLFDARRNPDHCFDVEHRKVIDGKVHILTGTCLSEN